MICSETVEEREAALEKILPEQQGDFEDVYKRQGFTTLRDVGSYFNVAVELRDAINAGKIVGPNIICLLYTSRCV